MSKPIDVRGILERAGADHDAPEGSQPWALAQVDATRALTSEKAGPVDGEVLVAIERGEGYEDVHPELVAEDCMGNAAERGWRWRVVSASHAPDKEGL